MGKSARVSRQHHDALRQAQLRVGKRYRLLAAPPNRCCPRLHTQTLTSAT